MPRTRCPFRASKGVFPGVAPDDGPTWYACTLPPHEDGDHVVEVAGQVFTRPRGSGHGRDREPTEPIQIRVPRRAREIYVDADTPEPRKAEARRAAADAFCRALTDGG